jgi:NADH-quinone oxidoreductase subunit H
MQFFLLEKLISFIGLVLPVLVSVAFFTLAERKIMGSIQQRKGPDFVGFNGLLQPVADAFKLMLKETVIPANTNTSSFILAPVISLALSLVIWTIIPFGSKSFFVNIDLGLFFFLTVSSLGVYGVIFSGWSSNSRYAFFGALRSAAQMISYEVSMGLIFITTILFIGSLNLISIVQFQQINPMLFAMYPLFLMFLITILAETNRPPFDLPEAESELVSGFNIEY